jgi:hypothetical protein
VKTFHQVILSALVTLGAFGTVLYSGCKEAKCGTAVCQNGSACSDNVCICPTGYSGANCGTTWINDCIGTYTCSETCVPGVTAATWESTVTPDDIDGSNTVYISNFGNNSSVTVVASVDSANNITISTPAGTSGINGNGTYTTSAQQPNGYITITYSTLFGQGASNYNCKMTMLKK